MTVSTKSCDIVICVCCVTAPVERTAAAEGDGRSMRFGFVIIFSILILALGFCAVIASKSEKRIGKSVTRLLVFLIPPVAGNMIIIASSNQFVSAVGWYVYLIGMDMVILALLGFTYQYCGVTWPNKLTQIGLHLLLFADIVQILCNPFTGHVFRLEKIIYNDQIYYITDPLLGQTLHRLLVYCIFLAVLIIFFVKMIRAPKIYSERFSIILAVMVFVGIWESLYIFSKAPIDRSMIGFGVFGILVFYFALYYRPMRLLDRMLSNVAQQMQESLFFFDAVGRCIWVNQHGMELTGVKDEEEFDIAAHNLREKFGDLGDDHEEWSLQFVSGSGSNANYFVLARHTLKDSKGRADGSFLSVRDNTQEQRTLKRERYNATHDRLTGLYVKEHLFRRTEEMLLGHPETTYLIIFVNVSEFKVVNDIFGNDFGDYTLQRIANRIRYYMTESCVYGRLGGDTFGICIPKEQFPVEQLNQLLSTSTVSDGRVEHRVLVHMGVYEVTERDLDVSVMFDRARMALQTIRETYNTYIAFYDDRMREQMLWNQKITTQLMGAIEQRQVCPYLQPMVDAVGRVVGAEALVRWNHPEEGFLSPGRFIPVFEKNGLIADVDKYMWRCACEILSRWQQEGRDLFLSVNISPRDFYYMDVEEEIRKVVREFDVEPSRLRIEITETIMMADVKNRVQILKKLKQDGFMVEMDDFGSGYSSLNMLKDMPVDLIKIDMTFLEESKDSSKAQTILHNIISMSDDLGISALTEGVETQSQYRMLATMGCKLFQGYYFAKPMPVDEFEAFCDAANEGGGITAKIMEDTEELVWNAT